MLLLSDLIRQREISRKARASVLFWLRNELQNLSAPSQIEVAQELVADITECIAEIKRHNATNKSVGIKTDHFAEFRKDHKPTLTVKK